MAQLNSESSFQSWLLTPAEIMQGQALTDLQEYVIQNMLVMAAETRLALGMNPEDRERHIELQSEIATYQRILETSKYVKSEMYNQVPQPLSQQETF